METKAMKQLCRLCFYETTDTTEIFGTEGKVHNYEGKINKYLYLHVSTDDSYPKTICWMCAQHLETFHKFYEKINQIQQSMLKDDYEYNVLRPVYEKYPIAEIEDDYTIEKAAIDYENENEDDNMVELLYVTDEFASEGNVNDALTTSNIEHKPNLSILNALSDDDNKPMRTQTLYAKTRTRNDIKLIKGLDEKSGEETYMLPDISESEAEPINSDQLELVAAESSDDINVAEAPLPPPVILNQRQTRSGRFIKTESNEPQISPSQKRKITGASKVKRPLPVKKKENENIVLLNESIGLQSKKVAVNVTNRKKSAAKQKASSKTKKASKASSPHHECDEGDSDDEFPARDSDNEDWPAQETMNAFPKQLIKNGLLLVKGKELMSIINKFYKLECERCKDKPRYKHLKHLFEHYSTNHNEVGFVTCCQTKFSRYPAIIMHMARHIQPEPFKCDECGYMVTRPRFLERHKQTHLPEDQKPFACDQCPRRFCWKGALQIHMISHQPADKRKLYVCHVCGKVYDTPGGLSTHKKQIHCTKPKKETNVCHVCAKIFATRTGLQEHMSSIHQPREKDQMQCTECGKWLMNYRCLKSHMILHSDATFSCTVCEYVTKKKVLLNRHMLSQHSNDKPFKCDRCDKAFKLKRALTVHLAKHGNTKIYKCPFCDRKFNSSTNFYTHRKSAHPQELQEMKNRELEVQREKRIAAGVENTKDGEVDPLYDDDGGDMVESDYMLTEIGDEITIINVKNEKNEAISVPIILDENGSIISANTIVTRYRGGSLESGQSTSQPIIIEMTDLAES